MKTGKKRERGGVASEDQPQPERERLESDLVDWHEQYEVIRRLNHETEKDLHDILELKKKSDVTFEQKIKLLEQKLILTNETMQSYEIGQKKMKVHHQENDINEIKRLQKEIEIYQMLTSIKLKEEENGRFLCMLKNENTKKFVKFAILATSNNEDVEYEPIANTDLLPDYLQSNLAFERALGPVMLGDAITSLFPPEEE